MPKSYIALILAMLVLACLGGQAVAGIMLDRVVAVVNDEAITWGELYKAMEFELSKDMKSLSIEQKKAVFEENEPIFLENMINQKLLLQEARRLNIGISREEVDAAINGIKKKFFLDDAQFIKALQADGFSLDEYRQRLAEQLVIAKLVDYAVKSQIVLSKEDLAEVSSGDAFYKLRQIFFKDGSGAQEKADKAMAELDNGADFVELARTRSEGPQASAGGDLGFVQKSKMAKQFKDALEGLSTGQTTKPFRTENGIHILKIEEIRGVREVLTDERLDQAYTDWLRDLRENALIEIRLK